MDVKYINPFIGSFINVMPQLGISNFKKDTLSVKDRVIKSSGVLIIIGIVGDFKGNVFYRTTMDCAKKIASTMMMGAEVTTLDPIAQSALSELGNMLAANASTIFSKDNIIIDISTPTLMYGDFTTTANSKQIISINMLIGDDPFEINIAIDK
ncbi:MAG: chemotaxis protein CheC [Clostridium sp.]|nr:chemotaxis protein CheC [Clostridium sp.]